jgi:hypothetical protein
MSALAESGNLSFVEALNGNLIARDLVKAAECPI